MRSIQTLVTMAATAVMAVSTSSTASQLIARDIQIAQQEGSGASGIRERGATREPQREAPQRGSRSGDAEERGSGASGGGAAGSGAAGSGSAVRDCTCSEAMNFAATAGSGQCPSGGDQAAQ